MVQIDTYQEHVVHASIRSACSVFENTNVYFAAAAAFVYC